ncbi:DMT family transporter [Homoserinibacter sp. YIM 151385]|uniref:DMT family transporter n=1 Tax=Homoserinibacter sp. YIM 151385 TaxID=2985506 RepID=UPI0022F01ADB|nr:EamA family transporter [Homoserinibacter sp. YIM 151385]WBU38461.1 EamA family transporter [Homoserinibacter sp. YIM 151385]
MQRAGMLALAAAAVLWGTTGTAASFLPDGVSPLATGAATMGLGGLLLAATAPRLVRHVLASRPARRWVLIGAIGVVVYPLAFYTSMAEAGVAIGNVVSLGSGPVFAAVLERVLEGRRLSVRWALSTGLALAGVALLAVFGHAHVDGARAGSVPLGVGLGLVAGASYALYTYASSRAIAVGLPSRGVMGAMFGSGALVLLPVLLALGAPLLGSVQSVGITAYLVLGPMAAAYVLFGIGLRTVRSSTATTVTLLEPVVATLLAVLVVGERLTAPGWVGMALVLAGLLVLASARRAGKLPASS